MIPEHAPEKHCSRYIFARTRGDSAAYQPAGRPTTTEWRAPHLSVRGYAYLQDEDCHPALNAFGRLQILLLMTKRLRSRPPTTWRSETTCRNPNEPEVPVRRVCNLHNVPFLGVHLPDDACPPGIDASAGCYLERRRWPIKAVCERLHRGGKRRFHRLALREVAHGSNLLKTSGRSVGTVEGYPARPGHHPRSPPCDSDRGLRSTPLPQSAKSNRTRRPYRWGGAFSGPRVMVSRAQLHRGFLPLQVDA